MGSANRVSDMQHRKQIEVHPAKANQEKPKKMAKEKTDIHKDGLEGLVLLNCSTRNEQVSPEISYQDIAKLVSEGRIVILKKVFVAKMMRDYRKALLRWWSENPPYPHGISPSATPEANYHRIDDGTIKSVCPHIFHQIGFNNISTLKNYVGNLSSTIAETMCDIQNAVAGTQLKISLTGLRLKVIHYPSGGGFLAEHTHPIEPQRVGLIASASRLGKDVVSGGTLFLTPFGSVDTTAYHDIGDVILFRYNLPHAVTVVDEDKNLDWRSDAGKWSIVLELRETHALSHSK